MGCLSPPGLGLTRVEAQQVPPGPLHRAAHTAIAQARGRVWGAECTPGGREAGERRSLGSWGISFDLEK